MVQLIPLIPVSHEILWMCFVVFLRVSAMMAVLPVFGDRAVPVRVRFALAIVFTLIIAPAIGFLVGPLPQGFLHALAIGLPEMTTGLFFGVLLRFFVFALEIAASIAAQSTSLSQIFGGSAGTDPQPAIGHLLVVSATALATVMGVHIHIAQYLIHTYQMVPVGKIISADIVLDLGLLEVGRCFALGFSLAAAFLVASLIYNVVLGVINRAMPQLMVSFIGAPAITAGGLLLLLISAPIMLGIWYSAFLDFMIMPFGATP